MSLQITGSKVEESRNLVFDLVKSHIEISSKNTLDKEEFRDILGKFVNDGIKGEIDQDRLRNTEIERSGKDIEDEKNIKDKNVVDVSALEEVIKLLSSIKEHLGANKKFDDVVKNIDKFIESLKDRGSVSNLVLAKNLLGGLLNSKEIFYREIFGKGSLNELPGNLIEKINGLLLESRSNFIQKGFEANGGKISINALKELVSYVSEKRINNSVEGRKYNNVEERIRIFDFRKNPENLLKNDKGVEKELANLKINRVPFAQENNNLAGYNSDFNLVSSSLETSSDNLNIRKVKNLSSKKNLASLGNVEQSFKKNVTDEMSSRRPEVSLISYTPVEFDKKGEMNMFSSTKATTLGSYFKLDFAYQLNQLAGTMIINLRNSVNEMRMTLFPPELGKVFVKFESTKDGKIVGNIVVSTKEAFTLFQEHLNIIKDTLQNQGFQFVDVNLSMSNDNFGSQKDFSSILSESGIRVNTQHVEVNHGNAYLGHHRESLEDATISLYA